MIPASPRYQERGSKPAGCPGSRPSVPPGRWWPLIVPASPHPQGSKAGKRFVIDDRLRWPPGGRLPSAIPAASHSWPASADLHGRHRCTLLAPVTPLHPVSMRTAASRTRRSSARRRALTRPAFPLRSPVTMLAVSPWVSPLGRLKSSLLAPALATTDGRSRPLPLRGAHSPEATLASRLASVSQPWGFAPDPRGVPASSATRG